MLHRTFFAPFIALSATLLVGMAGEYGFKQEQARLLEDQKSNVTSLVGKFRSALEGELNSTLFLTNGLVAYIKTHPSLAPEPVNQILKALYEQGVPVRNIGLAPGNRITYVYPLKGNEKALGLYFPDEPTQWPVAKQAIDQRKPILAGPLELKQGGIAFIYRVPVFTGPEEKYWGLLSMVLDKDTLFRRAGLSPETQGLRLALRGKDGEGDKGEVFWGDASLFESDSVKTFIATPGGTWELAAKPIRGWSAGNNVHWLRIGSWALGAILGLVLYFALSSAARRLRAEDEVRIAHAELNEAQRVAKIGSWAFDLRDKKLSWSDEIYRIFEVDPARFEASYEAFLDAIHPNDREAVDLAYRESVVLRKPYMIVHRLLLKNGRIKFVRETGETTYAADGTAMVSRGTIQDITQMHETEEALKISEERWKFALEGAGHGVWDWNLQSNEVYLSQQEVNVLGYEGDPAYFGPLKPWIAFVHPEDASTRKQAIDDYLAGSTPVYTCEFRTKARDGSWRWLMTRGMLVSRDPEGKPLRMIGTHTDITDLKKVEAELHQLAAIDFLTGAFNRRHFIEDMENELARIKRSGRSASLLMIDIDHFKRINDSLGHASGDVVLKQFSEFAMSQLRRSDRFGRLGGEEFAFLLAETDQDGAIQFANRFREAIAETPAQGAKGPIPYTISIGVAIFNPEDSDIEGVMVRADEALYRAKMNGRNRVEVD